jgi:hypothetical protein
MDNQKEDKEYQLTEKGKELAEQLAKKNAEKDKAQAKIQESLASEKKLSSTELKKQLDEVNRQIKQIEDLENQKKGEWVRTKKDSTEDEESQSYYKAKQIRKTGFADLMANKLLEGQGIGESFKKTLSEKTKAKMTGIKESFDPMNIAKKMTGGSKLAPALIGRITGRKQKDIEHFAGRATPLGGGADTATKVGKVDSVSDGMVGILSKILTLMQKSYDEDKLLSEETKSKEEEIKAEKERKDKAMLDVLKQKKKEENPIEEKIEKETGEGTSGLLSKILDAFGGAKTALTLLATLGGFVMSPIGAALIGAVVAGTLGKWIWKQIKGDPKSALEGKGGIGMATAGLGSEGQLPSYQQEKSEKEQKKLADAVNKKGIKVASLQELEAKRDLLVSYGKAKSPEVAELNNEIDSRNSQSKQNSTPSATPTQGSSASPVSGTASPAQSSPTSSAASTMTSTGETASPTDSTSNLGSQLAGVTGENLDSKLNELSGAMQKGLETVTNNIVNKSVNTPASAPIPSVRNSEETFQRMIWDSTRVV